MWLVDGIGDVFVRLRCLLAVFRAFLDELEFLHMRLLFGWLVGRNLGVYYFCHTEKGGICLAGQKSLHQMRLFDFQSEISHH